MICFDCSYMACRVFYMKTDRWEGLCINPNSENYNTKVYGNSGCTIKSDTKYGLFD